MSGSAAIDRRKLVADQLRRMADNVESGTVEEAEFTQFCFYADERLQQYGRAVTDKRYMGSAVIIRLGTVNRAMVLQRLEEEWGRELRVQPARS